MTAGRREQIVQAAQALAAEGGLEAVSVRSVARRAGIGATTLRHYFPTQGDLYDALLGPALDRMLSDLRIGDRRVAPRRRLLECLMQFFPPDFLRPETTALWFTSYAAAVGPAATGSGTRTLARLAALTRARIDGWMRQLEEEGALLDDREGALRFVLSVLDGICVQLITPGTVFTPEDVEPTVARCVGAILRG